MVVLRPRVHSLASFCYSEDKDYHLLCGFLLQFPVLSNSERSESLR